MKFVPCAIKTQDEFPGLVSSPRCCADVSVHRGSRTGIGTGRSAGCRSGEEASAKSLMRAWYKILTGSLTASAGVGDLRITKRRLLSCSHPLVWGVWLPFAQ